MTRTYQTVGRMLHIDPAVERVQQEISARERASEKFFRFCAMTSAEYKQWLIDNGYWKPECPTQ